MDEMVVGFVMDPKGIDIVLIKKRRGRFVGKFNGIGGHVEPGECAIGAMIRECSEETGAFIPEKYWKHTVTLTQQQGAWRVFFFVAKTNLFHNCRTTTDEEIEKVGVATLPGLHECGGVLVDNLYPILTLSLDKSGIRFPIHMIDEGG